MIELAAILIVICLVPVAVRLVCDLLYELWALLREIPWWVYWVALGMTVFVIELIASASRVS